MCIFLTSSLGLLAYNSLLELGQYEFSSCFWSHKYIFKFTVKIIVHICDYTKSDKPYSLTGWNVL